MSKQENLYKQKKNKLQTLHMEMKKNKKVNLKSYNVIYYTLVLSPVSSDLDCGSCCLNFPQPRQSQCV